MDLQRTGQPRMGQPRRDWLRKRQLHMDLLHMDLRRRDQRHRGWQRPQQGLGRNIQWTRLVPRRKAHKPHKVRMDHMGWPHTDLRHMDWQRMGQPRRGWRHMDWQRKGRRHMGLPRKD